MPLMGKSTISMAIFHCYVSSPEGILDHMGFLRASTKCFRFVHEEGTLSPIETINVRVSRGIESSYSSYGGKLYDHPISLGELILTIHATDYRACA